jgi:hypothetical protein
MGYCHGSDNSKEYVFLECRFIDNSRGDASQPREALSYADQHSSSHVT